MGTFRYEGMNAAGQEVKAEVEAEALEEALGKIRAKGCLPTKVRPVAARRVKAAARGGGIKRRGFNVAFGSVRTKVLTEFTRQLSTLQDAGLPILRSLRVLGQQQGPGVLRDILAGVANDVEGGATLSEAMARHPKAFNRLYVNMVQAGEAGGVLDVILQRLADFMEKAQRLRRRIVGAMIYPCVVITFAVLIVTGLMVFVVPKFQEIFRDFRATLPTPTVYLMGFSEFVAHRFGWALILGMPLGGWVVMKMVGRSAAGRRMMDGAALRLPVVGRIVRKTAVARFTRTLGTLLAAGVPILDALTIARETVGNAVFEGALGKVHAAIREGEGFAAPLRAARVCDPVVTNMIDVGEETGDLDKMLLKIAENCDEEVDVLVGSLVNLLEPVMVIALGGIVGTIVVALMMPLVTILDSMNNAGGGR